MSILDNITLQAGDILFYKTPDDAVSWAITRLSIAASHVELYEGSGMSLASRDGIGVNRYPLRENDLCGILEPVNVDMPAISEWFESVKGWHYSFEGLLGFLEGKSTMPDKELFCSAFVALAFLRTGKPLFNKLWPVGLITPSDLLKCGLCKARWVDISVYPTP